MINIAVSTLTSVFLIAIRIGTVIFFAPIQAIRTLPIHTRLFLILMFSLLIANYLSQTTHPVQNITLSSLSLGVCGITEFCNGLLLSLSIHAAFAIFHIAGFLIDTHLGLNTLAILNPTEHTHELLSSRLLMMLAVLFFFAMNAHHQLFMGLLHSFTIIPPGSPVVFHNFSRFLEQFSWMFAISFMIASPIIISLLIVDITGGILTRNMPQINLYFLTLPIKMMLGLLIFKLLLTHIRPLMAIVFERCFQSWQAIMV